MIFKETGTLRCEDSSTSIDSKLFVLPMKYQIPNKNLVLIMGVFFVTCQLKTSRKVEKLDKRTVSVTMPYLCYFLSKLNSVKSIFYGAYVPLILHDY